MLANKNISKGISLFIKTVIFVFSVYYIIDKIGDASTTMTIGDMWRKTQTNYFIIAFCLVPVNWGIEALKWKYLTKEIEKISFSTAFKAVLSGLSISIFTPNRVGEFAGKVFYLKTTEKVKATLASFIGSSLQFLVTILAGLLAAIVYYNIHKNTLLLKGLVNANHLSIFLIISLFVITIIAVLIYLKPLQIKEQLMQYEHKELSYIFILSLLRYIVFSFQYYLVLLLFNIDAGLLNSLLLVAFVFFVNSAIPSFALTEIAVRSATSIYFFSTVTNDANAIVSSSITLWMINLAIPALIGGAFIWQLNFFND